MRGDGRAVLGDATTVQAVPGAHRLPVGQTQLKDVPGGPAFVRCVHLHDHFQQPVPEVRRSGVLHSWALTQHGFQCCAVLHHPEANHILQSLAVLWHYTG